MTTLDRDMALRYAEAGVHRLVPEARRQGSAFDDLSTTRNDLINAV